jgi:glutamine synthetase adenylyltransferase
VEWTIQLLQLQHAHRVTALRTPSTTTALRVAGDTGLLARTDVEILLAAWQLATKTRNVLTLVRGKQVDQLPTSGRDLAAVARALGHSADAQRARRAISDAQYGPRCSDTDHGRSARRSVRVQRSGRPGRGLFSDRNCRGVRMGY